MDSDAKQQIDLLITRWCNSTFDRSPLVECGKVLANLSAADLREIFAYYSNSINEFRGPILDLIRANLDVQLMREHVAAQRAMSDAADQMQLASIALAQESNRLSRRSNWLAAASVFLAMVGLIQLFK